MVAQGIRQGFGPSGPSRHGSALKEFERQQQAAAQSSHRGVTSAAHGAAAQLTQNLAARHSIASHRSKIAERLYPPGARPKSKAPERR